jgi:hypothetical protein
MRNWLCGVLGLAALTACGGEEPLPVDVTLIRVTVVDRATQLPIEGAYARIGADGTWLSTQAGLVTVEVSPGTHTIWAVGPGHLGSPRPFEAAVETAVTAGSTAEVRLPLDAAGRASGPGRIRGAATQDGAPFSDGLAVARGPVEVGARLDAQGGFVFVDLPAGSYQVTVLARGRTATPAAVQVSADAEAQAAVSLSAGGGVVVRGDMGGSPGASSVLHLVHGASGLPVPGLSVDVSAGSPFTVEGVPPGTYGARTGLELGDGIAMDPELTRRGPVVVTVAEAPVQGVALALAPTVEGVTPTATASVTATPTLAWAAAPGADFYVVEVQDAAGRTVWGGLDASGNWRFRVLGRTEAVYEGPALVPGARYRWRVFAADQDDVVPSAFTLVAASEELAGAFVVER